jgi:hypothetical protein
MLDKHGSKGSNLMTEKKLAEYIETEKKLLTEIE